MTTFVLATNSVHTSAAICDYLERRVTTGDAVHAVNSQPGGDATGPERRDGQDALNVVRTRLGAVATVETEQIVGGNDPARDVLNHADRVSADEVVIGIRRRALDASIDLGATAEALLAETDRPVVVVPRE